jgi:hypothetical protein
LFDHEQATGGEFTYRLLYSCKRLLNDAVFVLYPTHSLIAFTFHPLD